MTSTIAKTSAAADKKDVQKLQRAIIDGLEDVKAQDIQVFDTEHITSLFERVIIASGSSNRQTKALAASVRDAVRDAGFAKPRIEGEENGEWIIVDCGAAVAHIMQPTIRQYYHLEELWGDKPIKQKLGAPAPLVKASKVESRAGGQAQGCPCRREIARQSWCKNHRKVRARRLPNPPPRHRQKLPPRRLIRATWAASARPTTGPPNAMRQQRRRACRQTHPCRRQGCAREVGKTGREDAHHQSARGQEGRGEENRGENRCQDGGPQTRRQENCSPEQMRLTIVAVGQKVPDWAQTAYDDYAKRFPPELKVELKAVKTEPRASKTLDNLLSAERGRIEASIARGTRVVALDERGTAVTTVALAEGSKPGSCPATTSPSS
jgi:ribosome silencing factor RsfS/YbeB/iojap